MVQPLEIIDQPEDRPRPPSGLPRSPPTQNYRHPFPDLGRIPAARPAMNGLAAAAGMPHNHPKQPSRPHSTNPDLQHRPSDSSSPLQHGPHARPHMSSLVRSSPSAPNFTMSNGYTSQAWRPHQAHRSHQSLGRDGREDELVSALKKRATQFIEDTSRPRSQLEKVHAPTSLKRPRDDTNKCEGSPPIKKVKDFSENFLLRQWQKTAAVDDKPYVSPSSARPASSNHVIDLDAGPPTSSAFISLLSDEEDPPPARKTNSANASPSRKPGANTLAKASPPVNGKINLSRPASNRDSPARQGTKSLQKGLQSKGVSREIPGSDNTSTTLKAGALNRPASLNSAERASPTQNSPAFATSTRVDVHALGTFRSFGVQAQQTGEPDSGHVHGKAPVPTDGSLSRVPEVPTTKVHDHSIPDLPLASRVERVLGKYVEELRTNTEHWNRTWLRRARCSRKVQDVIHELPTTEKPYSFADYPALQTPTKASGPNATKQVIVVEVQRGPAKIAKANFAVPVTHFTSVDKMPSYTHYVHIQNNFLALNETIMHYQPYFSEEFDDAEAANMRQHYFYDAAPRPRKLLQLSQAQSYDEYITSTLHELKILWADVLRFFLQEQPEVGNDLDAIHALRDRDKFCQDDFAGRSTLKYQRILTALPPSTPAQTATAATLCEVFTHMAKLSLWHIARLHLHDYLPAAKPKDMSVGKMTCRVCFRYDCPIHGEIYQGVESEREDSDDEEDDDVGSEQPNPALATDIIHPPKINYRTRIAFPTPDRAQDLNPHLATAESRPRGHAAPSTYEWKPEERKPFYPCNHPGTSCEDARCRCFRENIHCEKSCTCSPACHRRFPGCKCYHEVSLGKEFPGRKTMCYQDDRCACFKHARECDPDLCGPCRVCDVLDPVNLDNEDILVGRCRNASIQRGVTKHTLLGESAIHGFGLFAGADIKPHDFIGEYKGEIITRAEAERRGAMYEHQKLSYLFNLNKSQEIDSTYFGNKIRFINHAGNGKNNLYPRLVMVNTVHRIALYGARSVRKGYELFFDYGPLFPEAQLGNKSKDTPQTNPRNNAGRTSLLDEFYDVGYSEDEKGNYRARKVAGSRSRPAKPRHTAKKPRRPKAGKSAVRDPILETGASTPLEQAASASSSSLQIAKAESTREDDEISRVDPAERMMSYNIANDDGVSDEEDEVELSKSLALNFEAEEDEDDDEYTDDSHAVEPEDEDDLPYDDDDGPPVKRKHRPVKKR